MFLYFIKQYLIKRKLKSLVALNRHFVFPISIHKIDVLVDERYFNKIDDLEKNIYKFFGEKVVIKFLFYQSKAKKFHLSENYLYDKDVDFRGKFNGKIAEHIDSKSNIFISYTDIDHPIINLFSLHKKADFKIGFYQTNTRIFDFLINADSKDIEINLKELSRYLKIINKDTK